MTPTQRSLKLLRDSGYHAEVVEHWNSFAKVRHDLFGFIDIVAVIGDDNVSQQLRKYEPREFPDTLGVQTTTWSNVPARIKKIRESGMLSSLKAAGWGIVVHGWRKGKNGRYEVRIEEL